MDNKILKSANEYYKKNNIPTTTIDNNIYLELANDQFQLSENEIKFRVNYTEGLQYFCPICYLYFNSINV